MKVAVFGSSPLALEAALRFHNHEAAVTWFNAPESAENWQEFSTALGRSILQNDHKEWDKYYLSLVEYLKSVQSVKPYQVQSVTKRYLSPEETIPNHSRFQDLFRVIYQLDPEEFINQQKDSNPETYQRLTEEFVQSLQSSLEMYEDFDLVLDLRRGQVPNSMNVSGRALGEKRVGKEHLFYERDAIRDPGAAREIALIGSGDTAAEIVINLDQWLSDERNRLFIVAHEPKPFEKFLMEARPDVRSRLESVLDRMDVEFQREGDAFHGKLREWQELDDFIQAKKPRPVEPIPRLVFFSGHNATAVDQLIDKRRVFVTLEKPEWREGFRQPENNYLDLKTIGVDEIYVANGMKPSANEYLRKDETGYFVKMPTSPIYANALQKDLNGLQEIENEIFKLFSPLTTA